jgi:hypothetical protein
MTGISKARAHVNLCSSTAGSASSHPSPEHQQNLLPQDACRAVRNAIRIQILLLEAKQPSALAENDALYQQSKTILGQVQDRDEQLRIFRDLLATEGGRS